MGCAQRRELQQARLVVFWRFRRPLDGRSRSSPPPLARGKDGTSMSAPICDRGHAHSARAFLSNPPPRTSLRPHLRAHVCLRCRLPLDYRSDVIAHKAASLNGPHSSPPNRLMLWMVFGNLRSLVAEKGCNLPRTIRLGCLRCTAVTRGASGTLLLRGC